MPLLLIVGGSVFGGAMLNVVEPVFATGPLHAGKTGYALLVTVSGAGLVVGSLLFGAVDARLPQLRVMWLGGIAICGAGMLAAAAAPGIGWALAAFVPMAVANALMVAASVRLTQQLVPSGVLGSILGLRGLVVNAAVVASFISAGALIPAIGSRATIALGGLTLVVLSGIGAVTFALGSGARPVAVADRAG
jgi:MFS family permease